MVEGWRAQRFLVGVDAPEGFVEKVDAKAKEEESFPALFVTGDVTRRPVKEFFEGGEKYGFDDSGADVGVGVVEVVEVFGVEAAGKSQEAGKSALAVEFPDGAQAAIGAEEGGHVPAGDPVDLGVGEVVEDGGDDAHALEDVADGAEADDEKLGHGGLLWGQM